MSEQIKFEYPLTRRDETISRDYHGTKVLDPYDWLSEDNDEKNEWIKAQNDLTNKYLSLAKEIKEKANQKIEDNLNFPKYSAPFIVGDRYYFYYNTGLQNQTPLYYQKALDDEPVLFLDPNTFSEDGTTSLSATGFSKSGKYFAYGRSESGSDWQTIYVMDAKEGNHLEDKIQFVKFSTITWTIDDKGFFYSRYPKSESKDLGTETQANIYHRLYYHRIGTKQEEDELIYGDDENEKLMFFAEVTEDGKYLVLYVSQSTVHVNKLYLFDLDKIEKEEKTGLWKPFKLIDNFDAEYDYIDHNGTLFYFKTNNKADNNKIIQIDIANPDPQNWKVIVDEKEDSVLESARVVNQDYLVLCYLHNVANQVYLYNFKGELLSEIKLPDLGSVAGLDTNKKDSEFFIYFTSFLNPSTILHYDFKTQSTKIFKQVNIKGFDTNEFETKQEFYESKDGTKVPMFIISNKNTELNGENPCWLYGYGGFNITIGISFSVSRLVFIKHFGGIYCIANIRGGGEFGESWHKQGMLEKKQNVFDDFISAGEFLVDKKYTNPSKLIINGGSNGGLLVAAVTNQRPDLFGCCVAAVGVLDMLRFHEYTIGAQWCGEYGSSENKKDFEFLIKYSPLHNVKSDIPYPAVLLTTADHDDRVSPIHSFKFISELQFKLAKIQKQPLMIRIDTKSGHGRGKSLKMRIEETSDIYAFVAQCLGLKWKD
ncbi:prolyl endopeptidase [Anaeramoeba ignava]|uniref:Prolyl endopeptidase n=1 Tax=Anaeramoeba ignava TaxID=1746090 RepID=A0A9Q0LBW0_ANAIG|nr:prolyl endopeptidase [Anaeramoeba ignava]|eukprot:Anaeramoba_ignava/a749_163.p1 GENE.a749_163~~a749_163.p1  ORF type:complete len:707 (-),score=251.41 a749_163:74-2194(-)